MKVETARKLVDEVKKIAGSGYSVEATDVAKNNNTHLSAIIIRAKGEDVSPTIYIDDYCVGIEGGDISVGEAAQMIFDAYSQNKDPGFGIDVSKVSGKPYIMDHVEYKVVNALMNEELLRTVPHKKIVDLAAIYTVVIDTAGEGVASFIISNDLMNDRGITIDELDKAAHKNTEKSGFASEKITSAINELIMQFSIDHRPLDDDGDFGMYVLSNRRMINGASVLLYRSQFDNLAEKLRDDLLVIPSSIHEVMVIPEKIMDPSTLQRIVISINESQVPACDYLGDHVYKYSRETGELCIAS